MRAKETAAPALLHCCGLSPLPCCFQPPRKGGNAEANASCCLPGGGGGGPSARQPRGEAIPSPRAGPSRYALTLPFQLAWKNLSCSGRGWCQSPRSHVFLLMRSPIISSVGAGPARRMGLDLGAVLRAPLTASLARILPVQGTLPKMRAPVLYLEARGQCFSPEVQIRPRWARVDLGGWALTAPRG